MRKVPFAPGVKVATDATVPLLAARSAEATIFPAAANTKAVVATCVVFVPFAAVGAAGVPVNVGEFLSLAMYCKKYFYSTFQNVPSLNKTTALPGKTTIELTAAVS